MIWKRPADPFEEAMHSLRERVEQEFSLPAHSYHGPTHWSRVEQYGIYLAEQTGADLKVVRLFAIFHDCRREDDCTDPGHGLRGAERARELRDLLPLDDDAFETLFQACAGHTDLRFSHDPTIAACWDSDRLDLDRVGMSPSPDYMSTKAGKLLCSYEPLARRRLVGILR